MIKVIVVDDQNILKESLKFIIEQDPEIKVVALGENGNEALALCDRYLPDVILMDIKMPICDGITATKLIKSKYPTIKIIILTTFNDDENIKNVLANGADGYVLKDIRSNELIHSIKSVNMGLSIVHKSAYDVVLKQFESASKNPPDNNVSVHLTDRELSIIRLIVDGKSNREIAATIFISEGTVKNIISAILAKLDLKDRTQLAVFAIKNNLVD